MFITHGIAAFTAIAEAHTVHGAAKRLALTQTAVTQRLKQLEAELGVTLFTRSRRGMTLTPEGATLLQHSKEAAELDARAKAALAGEAQAAQRLTITGPTSIMTTRIIPACAGLLPGPLFTFHISDDPHRLEALRQGDADLAVVPRALVPKEMSSKLLKPERYLLVCSARWKGRRLNEILSNEYAIDFDADDAMTFAYLAHFGIEGARSERHFVNDNGALIRLLVEGHGYGVLTEEVARPYLGKGLWALRDGVSFANALALVWYERRSALFSRVVQALR